MKFSDLMLDLATGDASIHDAYVAEAMGKIDVSHAYFEAAYKISELPEGEDFMILQEAADAGLPTDNDGANAMACAAVQKELEAFYDLMVATAKKTKLAMDKNMKAFAGIGKTAGITMNDTNIMNFAEALASAITSGKGKFSASLLRGHVGAIELGSQKFLAPLHMKKITKKYVQGMSKGLATYAISIDQVFGDEIVKKYGGGATKVAGTPTLQNMATSLASASGQLIDRSEVSVHGNKYRTNVTKNDIVDFIYCVYTIKVVSEMIIQIAGNKTARKAAVAIIENAACNNPSSDKKTKGKTISAAAHDIDETVKDTSGKMDNVVDNIVKSFTDSTYALVEALNGGKAPLPKYENNEK